MKRLLIAALLLGTSFAWADGDVADEPKASEIVPRYILMDTRGRAVSNQDFAGRFQLIAFGYTFCPDICPTTLAEMSLIMQKLGSHAARLQPLFITVDPERDTPDVLSRYTRFFDPRIIGLTGTPELVRRVADHFKIRYEKHWEPGADKDKYSVDHSAGMYLLGPDGEFLAKFAYATPPQEITARIQEIMGEDTGQDTTRRGNQTR